MDGIFQKIWLCFIPLLVAIDAPGMIPIFISMTDDMTEERRHRLLRAAVLTALGVSVLFLFSGRFIFSFLGITENDFRIGGGIVLLVFAVSDLLFPPERQDRGDINVDIGVVPLGIPLIMGPAALTTTVISADSHGYVATLIALVLNLALTWILFHNSKHIARVIGNGGAKAFAKVASLFLAAIAVMMIRIGITNSL